MALAHEIYGNVQHFLEFSVEGAKPQTTADRISQERKAFQASIQFLEKIAQDEKAPLMPTKMRNDLLNLMPSEIKAYQSWLEAHPSLARDRTCDSLLSPKK